MAKASASTTAAIVIGAGLGAFAAMMAKQPARTNEVYPRDHASLAVSASPPGDTIPPAPEPPAQPEIGAPSAHPSVAPSASPEASDLSLASAEQGCARHVPRSCLAAAEYYEAGRDVHADANKARLFRVIAASILDERCKNRDPESCNDLASLYASGTGVPQNTETAQTLSARTRELCSGRDTPFCSALAAGETH